MLSKKRAVCREKPRSRIERRRKSKKRHSTDEDGEAWEKDDTTKRVDGQRQEKGKAREAEKQVREHYIATKDGQEGRDGYTARRTVKTTREQSRA